MNPIHTPEAPAFGDGAVMGLGETLRRLREARRLSLGEVSARLKFSVRQIEALEAERWDDLPPGVSLRGMVKNYGRYLQADEQALLSMLDSQCGTSAARVRPAAGALQPADTPLHGEPTSRPWGWLVVILVLLFIAGFYAVERGWIPEQWLIFDWMKSLKQ